MTKLEMGFKQLVEIRETLLAQGVGIRILSVQQQVDKALDLFAEGMAAKNEDEPKLAPTVIDVRADVWVKGYLAASQKELVNASKLADELLRKFDQKFPEYKPKVSS